MAYDFRSEGIRAQRLIASGTDVNNIGLLIYSSSNASNMAGSREAGLTSRLTTAGSDVWLYVDGVPSNDPRFNNTRDQRDGNRVVLFKGDVVISGTLYAQTQVISADESVAGNLLVPNNLYVSGTSVFNNARRATGDLIVRTTDRSHALFVDASTDKVGIGFGVEETDDSNDSWPTLSGTLHIAEQNGRAVLVIENQSTGSGANSDDDAQVSYRLGGYAHWSHGVDDSDSDKFNLSYGDKLGTNRVLSVVTGSTPAIVWNEDSADMDFRIESNDETHMFWVDAGNNRVFIGDGGASVPNATLELTNHATAGAFGVPLLQLNNKDVDQIGLDINLSNTTAIGIDIDASNTTSAVVDITADSVTSSQVLNISADGLTSGHAIKVEDNSSSDTSRNIVAIIQSNTSATNAKALLVQSDGGDLAARIDKNASGTAAQNATGLHIDFDRTVPGSGTSAHNDIGINLDVDSRSLGTSTVKGMDVDVTGHTDGTHTATGLDVVVTGADTNEGLLLTVDDGGTDIKLMSSADTGDYFSIATTTAGATTITTVDDDAAAANLTMTIDGNITLDAEGNVDIDADSGSVSIDGSSGINIGTETDVAIDIDSSTLDIDASGAITIDGTSTLSIDSADDSNITVTGAGKELALAVVGGGTQKLKLDSAGTGTDAIDITASGGGVDVDAAGKLALDGAGGIDIGVSADVAIDIDSSTLDIDASGAITIDGASTISIDGAGALNIDTSSGAISIGAANSATAVNIGHGTSEVTIGDNLTVSGDLTVNGTTTTVNSTTMTVDDPVLTLGGDVAPGSDDNKDRGIEFRWHNGSGAKTGFMGYDDDQSVFTLIPDATNSSEVFSGDPGTLRVRRVDLYDDGAENISGDGTDISITVGAGGDVNIPSNIGLTFGNDGEKIEGNGSKLTIASGDELTLDSEGAIRLDSDTGFWHLSDNNIDALVLSASSGDVTVNVPTADKDLVFKVNFGGIDDVEVMRLDGSSRALLMAGTKKIQFASANSYMHHDGTDLKLYDDADINLVAGADVLLDATTTVKLDSAAGDVSFETDGAAQLALDMDGTAGQVDLQIKVDGDDLVFKAYNGNEVIRVSDDRKLYFYDQGGEAISSDGTDMTIESGQDINLTAATNINIPSGVGLTFGNDNEKITGNGTQMNISSGGTLTLDGEGDITLDAGGANVTIKDDGVTSLDIVSNGATDVTFDAPGDISLDADGGDVYIKDGGVTGLRFHVATAGASGATYIDNGVDGNDVIFRVDAGSTEVMRLDDSAGALLMAAAKPMQFRDANTAMSSSASGKLDVYALGQLLLTASTVEMKVTNAVEVKGDMNISGTLTPSALSLSNITLASNGYLRYGDTSNYIQRSGNDLQFRDASLGAVKTLSDLATVSGIGPFEVVSTEGPATLKMRTTGSLSLDSDNGYVEAHGTDIFMFVSSSWGTRYKADGSTLSGDRNLPVIGGDLLVSGNVEMGHMSLDGGTLHKSGKPILAVSGSAQRAMALVSGSLRFQTQTKDYLGEISPGYLTATSESEEDIYIRNIRSSGRIVFQAGGDAAAHQIASFRGDTGALRMGTSKKIEFAGTSNHISAGGANQLAISAGTGNITTTGHIVPASNNTYDLGSEAVRFRNVYTGDLNLKNERGDWTILEEEDFLCVINNKTGKKFKMMLEPIEENE